MIRTPLRDRALPPYTPGEEKFHMLSHALGAVLGMLTLIFCLLRAGNDPWAIIGCSIYGAGYVALYLISALYHGLGNGKAKRVFQVLDHCSIYFFIAATYTPLMLCALRPINGSLAYGVLGLVWGLGIIALVLNAIDLKKFSVFSMACYILTGWSVIFCWNPVHNALPGAGFPLLLSGGIAYTLGAIFYGLGKKKRCSHGLFHVLCLAGSALQGACIYYFALPAL